MKIEFRKSITERKPFLWFLIIVGALYARTLTFDLTYSDDDYYVLHKAEFNSDIRNIPKAFTTGYADIYYRPIVITSFIIDAQIGKTSPVVYHATNVLLHYLVTCCLFILLHRLRFDRLKSFLISVLFLIHPLNTQTVAWIPGRNDSLVTLFALVSFIFFLRYVESKKNRDLVLHVLAFTFALLSKEIAIAIPIVCILYVVMLHRESVMHKSNFIPVSSWIGLIIGWYVLRSASISDANNPTVMGFSSFISNLPTILEYIFHFYSLIGLSSLSVFHSDMYFALPGIFAFAWVVIRKKDEDKPMLIFGACWFLLFLIPALFVRLKVAVDLYDYLECRAYLPVIGLFIILVALKWDSPVCARVISRYSFWRKPFIYVTVLLAFISLMSFTYSGTYHDRTSYFKKAAFSSRDRSLVRYNLGKAYHAAHDFESAKHEYRRAIELNPNRPDAYVDLGEIYFQEGKPEQSIDMNNKALKMNSRHALALTNLGAVYYKQNRMNEAIELWKKAIDIDHDLLPAYENIFHHYFTLERFMDASAYVESLSKRGIQLHGGVASSFAYYRNRVEGRRYFSQNKFDDAESYFKQAIEKKPDAADAYIDLGAVYFTKGMIGQGIEMNQKAITLNPKAAAAYSNVGIAYGNTGRFDEAAQMWQKAIAADSNFIQAYDNLLRYFLSAKKYSEAREYIDILRKKGITIAPELEKMLMPRGEDIIEKLP